MPRLEIPRKLEPILTTKARLIVLVGGRSSTKSETVARVLLMKAQTERADVMCGREYQNSIDDSVHKLLKNLIEDLRVDGFSITDKKIDCLTGGGFRFKGFSRNSEAVKSAQNFKYSWIEEAQSLSQQSIDDLLPTIRAPGSKLFFTANPQNSADPFSQRFITPYLVELKRDGFYEDDMHLIIFINWRDNPWHGELEGQRQWDYEHLSRAKYDYIWEGEFNDSVEDALIKAEWFDSCVDAHIKLGFKPIGMRMASHDPADEGSDAKSYAARHGSVVYDVCQRYVGNINEGGDWAFGKALQQDVDAFTWDCDGLGVGLSRQVSQSFEGKHTRVAMFKGSEGVDFPEAIFEPDAYTPIQGRKTNKQAIKNKRAQYYIELRKRILNTHNAVVNGVYCDPEKMISFSSDIEALSTLRSELSRMPIKPNTNGLIELYTKVVMKDKFKILSPNCADAVMMLMRQPHMVVANNSGRPAPIKSLGQQKR